MCLSFPPRLSVPVLCIKRVCPTSLGVWSEGESPSILCGAPERSAGQDGCQSPQPVWSSGGVCRHWAGERSVCVSRQHIAANRRLKKPQKSAKKEKRKLFLLVTKLFCPPDKYAVRFIPRENGIHYIDVKFNGSHIPGSPFQVRVGEPGQTGEPGLVSAYGAGLERGTTGGSPVRLFTWLITSLLLFIKTKLIKFY